MFFTEEQEKEMDIAEKQMADAIVEVGAQVDQVKV